MAGHYWNLNQVRRSIALFKFLSLNIKLQPRTLYLSQLQLSASWLSLALRWEARGFSLLGKKLWFWRGVTSSTQEQCSFWSQFGTVAQLCNYSVTWCTLASVMTFPPMSLHCGKSSYKLTHLSNYEYFSHYITLKKSGRAAWLNSTWRWAKLDFVISIFDVCSFTRP